MTYLACDGSVVGAASAIAQAALNATDDAYATALGVGYIVAGQQGSDDARQAFQAALTLAASMAMTSGEAASFGLATSMGLLFALEGPGGSGLNVIDLLTTVADALDPLVPMHGCRLPAKAAAAFTDTLATERPELAATALALFRATPSLGACAQLGLPSGRVLSPSEADGVDRRTRRARGGSRRRCLQQQHASAVLSISMLVITPNCANGTTSAPPPPDAVAVAHATVVAAGPCALSTATSLVCAAGQAGGAITDSTNSTAGALDVITSSVTVALSEGAPPGSLVSAIVDVAAAGGCGPSINSFYAAVLAGADRAGVLVGCEAAAVFVNQLCTELSSSVDSASGTYLPGQMAAVIAGSQTHCGFVPCLV